MTLHPFVRGHARGLAVQRLHTERGVGWLDAALRVWRLDSARLGELAEQAAARCGAEVPGYVLGTEAEVAGERGEGGEVGGKIGDFLAKIVAWLESPAGQAFLSALVTLIVTLLMV